MTITQITASASSMARGGQVAQIFGLGDDQKVYLWDTSSNEWRIFGTS